jgi:hypothetical protein
VKPQNFRKLKKVIQLRATRPKSIDNKPRDQNHVTRDQNHVRNSTYYIQIMQLTKKLQASFGRFKRLFCGKTQLLFVALVVLFCNSVPLTRPSHLTSVLGRDMNLHPFRKEMSSFCFRLDFLIPSNAYSDRSFCLSLAESNHA